MTKQFFKYTKCHYNYSLINPVNFAPANLVVNDPNSIQIITFIYVQDQRPTWSLSCYIITEIEDASKSCYRDIPGKFEHNNNTILAFLSSDIIIRRTSKQVLCEDVLQNIYSQTSIIHHYYNSFNSNIHQKIKEPAPLNTLYMVG